MIIMVVILFFSISYYNNTNITTTTTTFATKMQVILSIFIFSCCPIHCITSLVSSYPSPHRRIIIVIFFSPFPLQKSIPYIHPFVSSQQTEYTKFPFSSFFMLLMHASMHFSHNNNTTQCTVHIAHTTPPSPSHPPISPNFFLRYRKKYIQEKLDTKYICMFFLVSIQVSRQKNPFRNLRHGSTRAI